ncbi:hypothetical protein SRHO_G00161360 [Serrasalmus rhombeus]
MEGKSTLLTTGDLIFGPQGVAVEAVLDEAMMQWYKVANAIPHVSLMTSANSEPKDLGPMMKVSKEINWDQINSHHTLQQTEKQEISLQRVRAESQDLSRGASPEQRHLMTKTQIDVSESLGYGW